MASMHEEMQRIRHEAGLPVQRQAPPLEMRVGKMGRRNVQFVRLDKWSLQHLAEKHGVDVRLDHTRDIYMELPDDAGEPRRFYAGDWYVESGNGDVYCFDDDRFQELVVHTAEPEDSEGESGAAER